MHKQQALGNAVVHDMRNLIWCSIDNDDSKDLDQLSYAEELPGNKTKVIVAVADVDALVQLETATNDHALQNTTSIYTVPEVFPMLPEQLSTDMTSLNFESDRLAIIIEMVVEENGAVTDYKVYQGWVRNHAKLAYNSVAAWLDGTREMPDEINAVPKLKENLILQDKVAHAMKELRHEHGALELETPESSAVFDQEELLDLVPEESNRAKNLIEDFMIATNGVVARFLASKGISSFRRIVKTPERWDRIVEIAAEHGYKLPAQADSKSLNEFLLYMKKKNPLNFPDVSLSVIKLLGPGEYVVEQPHQEAIGHFGLAVKDYTHSTAPNRRYPDLITQRLVKAALNGKATPYGTEDLEMLATHCTQVENIVKKVERQIDKSAAALLLESRIGQYFDGYITGSAPKGTWVRILHPHVEGKVIEGEKGLDVGQHVRVQLVSTDVEHGHIDFKI